MLKWQENATRHDESKTLPVMHRSTKLIAINFMRGLFIARWIIIVYVIPVIGKGFPLSKAPKTFCCGKIHGATDSALDEQHLSTQDAELPTVS